jgi:hypothetical protein
VIGAYKPLIPKGGKSGEVVGARGFEPPTLRSRTVRATKLRYAPSKDANANAIRRLDQGMNFEAT